MIPNYTEEEYNNTPQTHLLSLKCENCGCDYTKQKRFITYYLKTGNKEPKYCSLRCSSLAKRKRKETTCKNCGLKFIKEESEYKKSKSGNSFCSKSCATTYNNKNKKHGTRSSKLEMWLKEQLELKYPDFTILLNNKSIVNSELDIWIPELDIAFEIHGIFHYKPIYGIDKYFRVLMNDVDKSIRCKEEGITLYEIDASGMSNFNENQATLYLYQIECIIENILSKKL